MYAAVYIHFVYSIMYVILLVPKGYSCNRWFRLLVLVLRAAGAAAGVTADADAATACKRNFMLDMLVICVSRHDP